MKQPLLFIYFIVLISLPNYLLAQKTPKEDGSIRGKVIDKNTNLSIPNAVVEIIDGKRVVRTITTGEDGTFVLEKIPVGEYNLICKAPQHIPQCIESVQVRMDMSKLAYFRMKVGNDATEPEVIATYSAVQSKVKTEVSTANQVTSSLFDAPANIYIITAQEIQERGFTTLIELLETIPEIEIQERGSMQLRNIITLRGVEGSGHFLLLLNGVRINSLSGSNGIIDRNISIRYAKQVEIIVGSTSALYGADALSGVINIISETGKNVTGVNATTSFGMYNTTDNAIQVGWGNDKVSVNAIGGFYYSSEPYMPDIYPEQFKWYNNHYLKDSTNLVWSNLTLDSLVSSTGQKDSIGVSFNTDTIKRTNIEEYITPHYAYYAQAQLNTANLEFGFMHNTEIHSAAFPFKPEFTTYTGDNVYGMSATSVYGKQRWSLLKDKLKLTTVINFNRQSINNNTTINNSSTLYNTKYQTGFDNSIELRQQAAWNLHKNHTIYGGIALVQTTSLGQTAQLDSYYVKGASPQAQNLFYSGTNSFGESNRIYQKLYFVSRIAFGSSIQYEGNLSKKFSIGVGLRFDYLSTQFEFQSVHHQLSPKVHFIWKLNDNWRIKGIFRSNFIPPSIQQSYAHNTSFIPKVDSLGHFIGYSSLYAHIPNLTLAPTQGGIAELLVSYAKKNLLVSCNGYVNILNNLPVNTYLIDSGSIYNVPVRIIEKVQNQKSSVIAGFTLQTEYRVLFNQKRNIQLKVNAAYSAMIGNSEIDSSNSNLNKSYTDYDVPYSAYQTIKAGIVFVYSKFNISTNFLYRSYSYNEAIPNVTQQVDNNPYLLANFFLQYRILDKRTKLDMFVKIRNAFNLHYYNVAEANPFYMGTVPQDPIRITIGASIQIGKK